MKKFNLLLLAILSFTFSTAQNNVTWEEVALNVDSGNATYVFNLMDDLFPLTMSCIGFEKETNYFTEPCKKCYWCHEKKWAFGCYDGGLNG